MFKRITPALFSLLLAFPFCAHAEPKILVGLGVTGGSATHTMEGSGIGGTAEEEIDVDSSAANVHIGFMLKNNNRFVLSAETITMEDDTGSELEASGLRLDWHFVYTEYKAKPYFGLGFGFYSSKDLAQIFNSIATIKESSLRGVSFQLMGGLKIALSENVELDAFMQSRGIAWQDIDFYSSYGGKVASIEQFTSDFSLGLGLDFKF